MDDLQIIHTNTANKDNYPDDPPVQDNDSSDVTEFDKELDKPSVAETVTGEEPESDETDDVDDYGNEVGSSQPRMYSQDEVNEMIRERVARFERNQAQASHPQTQNQSTETPQDEADWKAELKAMIENTVQGMTQKQQEAQRQAMEAQAQQAFEEKFHAGMSKFKDFQDVVGKQNITDSMVLATRAMSDPAAFIYAASKKASDDLNRIANIKDPYVQMVEMGRLEAKLKTGRKSTQAPRPLGKIKEDVSSNYSNTTTRTVDDLIAESNKKRLEIMNARATRRR